MRNALLTNISERATRAIVTGALVGITAVAQSPMLLSGEHFCRGGSLLAGLDHRWRWLAIEIVRVV